MYSNLDTAYNDNSDDLDRMARQLNKKKEEIFKNEENLFEKEQEKWAKQINYYMDEKNYNKIDSIDGKKFNNNDDLSLDSLDLINSVNNKSLDDDISLSSISIDSPTIDSYIMSIKKNKNNKSVKKIINNISTEKCSQESDDIFEHLRTCNECKIKLLENIKNNHNKENKEDKYNEIIKKKQSLFNYFSTIENKEIITIIFLGMIIIIIIDFIMKPMKRKI